MDKYLSFVFPALIVCLIIYRRIKMTVGFQKYYTPLLVLRIIVFSIIATVLSGVAIYFSVSLWMDALGILLGIILVTFAIRNTVFENRNDVLYYRTHIWIELTVLLLFFSRFVYRFYLMYGANASDQTQQLSNIPLQNAKDPFTSSVFFILCTYYIGYYVYILKTGKRALQDSVHLFQ